MTVAVLLVASTLLSIFNGWLACYFGKRAQSAWYDRYQKLPAMFYFVMALAAAASCFVWMYRAHRVWVTFV